MEHSAAHLTASGCWAWLPDGCGGHGGRARARAAWRRAEPAGRCDGSGTLWVRDADSAERLGAGLRRRGRGQSSICRPSRCCSGR